MNSAVSNNVSFKSNPLINATSFIEERVMLNKALLDGSKDISTILQTNNSIERRERINRFAIIWSIAFLTPLVTLPLTNRLAMKYIAKLSKGFSAKENNLIKLSNKYLGNKELTKQGIEELSKKYDFSKLLKENNYDYEKIRKKLINAKNSVLAFDFLFTTSLMGSAGFINRYRTRKKTGKDGFSAEFNMGDKNLIEKRAEKFKKSEKLRNNIFMAALALLTASPLILKKGLTSTGKFADLIKKHAYKFDYNDGIFMKRLPFFLMAVIADVGILMSSRNKTEVKDNATRLSATQAAYFGGDIVIGSTLAALSDKFFKTDLLNKNCEKNFINKIIPPIKNIKELTGKNKIIGTTLFWVNMVSLFGVVGIGIPQLMNKMIKKDVSEFSKKSENNDYSYFNQINNKTFKDFKLK